MHICLLADNIIYLELLSPLEMKEAFLFHAQLMNSLYDLPDIRSSKSSQRLWQGCIENISNMFNMCMTTCKWASQHGVDRRQVQTQAARIQVETHDCPELIDRMHLTIVPDTVCSTEADIDIVPVYDVQENVTSQADLGRF